MKPHMSAISSPAMAKEKPCKRTILALVMLQIPTNCSHVAVPVCVAWYGSSMQRHSSLGACVFGARRFGSFLENQGYHYQPFNVINSQLGFS